MPFSEENIILPDFFSALRSMAPIDAYDWQYATCFAEKWKMSVADTLLDLNFVDETTLAQALAKAHALKYIPGHELRCDFSGIDLETFHDLMSVGAAPLEGERLAICNPYDDFRGNLSSRLCQRDLFVTERTWLFEALRKQGLLDWLNRLEADK